MCTEQTDTERELGEVWGRVWTLESQVVDMLTRIAELEAQVKRLLDAVPQAGVAK
jgi:hypothetical protein